MEYVNISFKISKSNSGLQGSLKLAAILNNVAISDFCDGVFFFCFDSINLTKQDVEIMALASLKFMKFVQMSKHVLLRQFLALFFNTNFHFTFLHHWMAPLS